MSRYRNRWNNHKTRQTEISWLNFDLEELADEVRRSAFPELKSTPRICFAPVDTLAFISYPAIEGEDELRARRNCIDDLLPDRPAQFGLRADPASATVVLHSLLNHAGTPRPVIREFLVHEFLHLLVGLGIEDGKPTIHPRLFREEEARRSPQVDVALSWCFACFHTVLKRDRKRECIKVLPRLARDRCFGGRLSLNEIAAKKSDPKQDPGGSNNPFHRQIRDPWFLWNHEVEAERERWRNKGAREEGLVRKTWDMRHETWGRREGKRHAEEKRG